MTRQQHRMEIVVGVTVVIAMFIIVGVILWGKGSLLSSQRQVLTFKFDNVSGLSRSDEVVISGVEVGKVSSITLVGDSVIVKARIHQSVQLYQDAQATIVSHQLMDGKLIDLSPGSSGTPLQEDHIIRGTYVPGIMNLTQILYGRREEIGRMITDLQQTASQMRQLFNQVPADSFAVGTAMQNLVHLSTRLDTFIEANAGMVHSTLSNLEQSSVLVNDFLASQDSAARHLLVEGQALTAKLRRLSDSTQTFVDKVNSPHSSLGRLLRDDSLYARVNRSLSNFDSLLLDFQNNPKRYLDGVQFKLKLF